MGHEDGAGKPPAEGGKAPVLSRKEKDAALLARVLAMRAKAAAQKAAEGTPAALATTTSGAVKAVYVAPSTQAQDPETQPTISFAEAAQMLQSETGFRLDGWRKSEMEKHKLVGLTDALQAKGVVRNDAEYWDLFDQVKFTPEGLKELIRGLKAGEKWEPTFNPGHLSYAELWDVLFLKNKGNIPPKSERDVYYYVKVDPHEVDKDDPLRNRYISLLNGDDWKELMDVISEMREVDPRDIEGLQRLDPYAYISSAYGKRYRPDPDVKKNLTAVYQRAYEKAPELKPGAPQVLFTLNEYRQKERSNVSRSPIEYAQDALNGTKYMDPMSDLIRLRMKFLDHNLGDEENQYPLFVSKKGKVIQLSLLYQETFLTLQETSPSEIGDTTAPLTVLS